MPRSISHADLVARALDALPQEERARVDAALEADTALRQRFEAIAGHLLQYDALPPAPPPPPFERIAAAMDANVTDAEAMGTDVMRAGVMRRDRGPDLRVLNLSRGARRAWLPVGAAAAALVALLLWAPWRGTGEDGMHIVPGPGLSVVRNGTALSAPAHARRPLQGGDELRCEAPAEARLARARMVLDAGARLRVDAPGRVTLLAGRAWFDVASPAAVGTFEVGTAYGAVRVLGTVFEVDVREHALGVSVSEGSVDAAGSIVAAGTRLSEGVVRAAAVPPGAWFQTPSLRLRTTNGRNLRSGEPLELDLVFENAGRVAMRLPGPGAARTSVWLRFESAAGEVIGELPVLSDNVTSGIRLLEPGASITLEPGTNSVLAVRILPPFGSAGAYRCKALYRPEGQPAVLSSPLEIEVR